MEVSQKGIDHIKKWESFRPNVYSDSTGNPTIGYGTLIDTVEEQKYYSTSITKEEAEKLLYDHLERVALPAIEKYVDVKLKQHEIDALASFIYNVGVGNFRDSTLRRKINQGASEEEIRAEFMKWNKSQGVELQGLTNRRESEADLFFLTRSTPGSKGTSSGSP